MVFFEAAGCEVFFWELGGRSESVIIGVFAIQDADIIASLIDIVIIEKGK